MAYNGIKVVFMILLQYEKIDAQGRKMNKKKLFTGVFIGVCLAVCILIAYVCGMKGNSQMGKMRILFIGNSHTFFHDMPERVAERFRADGYDCEVTMLAHGGGSLEQHAMGEEARFNILYGHYDYVVLQELSHPFAEEEKYFDAVRTLNEYIQKAGSKPVIYMTWARKAEPELQDYMTDVHTRMVEEIDALLAPVGEKWWEYQKEHPDVEMYFKDGAHASAEGSGFAADIIYSVIKNDKEGK